MKAYIITEVIAKDLTLKELYARVNIKKVEKMIEKMIEKGGRK